MPHQELLHLAYAYDVQKQLMQQLVLLNQELDHAGAIAQRKPPEELDTQDIKDLIDATSLIQGHMHSTNSFLQFARLYAFVSYDPASSQDSNSSDVHLTPPDLSQNPTIPLHAK
jgi:hypothetical protein